MMLALLIQLLALGGAVQCLPWDEIKPTGVFNKFLGIQEPPQTTQPARLELRKRQAPGDSTCGYEDGISSAALYCLSEAVCATNSLGGMGCCYSTSLDNCLLPTSCIDSTALGLYAPSFLANPYIASCTEESAPLCITQYFQYNSVVTGFDCGSTASFLTQFFYTTAANTTVPSISIFNAVYIPTPTSTSSPTSSSQSQSSTSSSSSASSTPSPTLSPTPSPNPTPNPTPSQSLTPPSSPTPVGAIVGGVVGGVAVIAIVGLILFFLLRRNKRQPDPQPQYPVAAPMQQTLGSPPQPQQMYPQQQQQYQYPSPTSIHSQPQTYPVAGYGNAYQTSYTDKMATQNNAYQVYGSPQFTQNEPVGSGSERLSVGPQYSPDPSSAGGFEGKNNMAMNTQPSETIHELGEQNRYNPES